MQIPHGVLNLLGFNATGDLGPLTAYTSRRHGTVWFLKAPPLEPPSLSQIWQRNRFRDAAEAWRNLTNDQRNRWHDACRRARLYLNGYTLWIVWQLLRDRATISTIERQSGVTLL